MIISRWITTSQLYFQGQKFKWYKNSSFNFLQQQGKMFKDIGAIAELEPNEITSTWLFILVFTLYSFHSFDDFIILGYLSPCTKMPTYGQNINTNIF